MIKLNNRINIFLGIMVFIIFICNTISKVYGEEKLFNNIISKANGEIVECGIVSNYEIPINNEIDFDNILNKLGVNKKSYKRDIKNINIHYIEFENKEIKGYIEKVNQDSCWSVTLNIRKITNKNDIERLEKKLKYAVGNDKVTVSRYIKAKINENNLYKLNNQIIANLKMKNVENIRTIKISNGYSTIACTGVNNLDCMYKKKSNLQYVLCKYHSGNYIVIATPEILISF